MITVLIADDEVLVRTGLRLVLEPAGDIEVVAEAGDGREAIEAVAATAPQVVLMDIRMPGMDGLTALEELTRIPDAPPVIVLTTFDLDSHVRRALRSGAAGFLLKDTDPDALAAAIRAVVGGGAVLAPSIAKRVISSYADAVDGSAEAAGRRLEALTPRERQVARAVSEGRSNAEIAESTGTSETSVKAHVSRSLSKLGLANRVQLALLAHQADDGRAGPD